jgi:hypothetical protein
MFRLEEPSSGGTMNLKQVIYISNIKNVNLWIKLNRNGINHWLKCNHYKSYVFNIKSVSL